MLSCRFWSIGAAAAVGLAAIVAGSSAEAADGPPACAKIIFRALPSGQNDGEQEAGVYHSRFTHLEVKATVKSGEAQDYYVTAHNKKLGALAGAIPATAANCAKDKKLPAPANAAASCTGDHFATVISHSGKDKIVLFYGGNAGKWSFCSSGLLGTES
jgi:hypothetical protein